MLTCPSPSFPEVIVASWSLCWPCSRNLVESWIFPYWFKNQLSEVCQVSYQLPLFHLLSKFQNFGVIGVILFCSSLCPYGFSAFLNDLFTIIIVWFQEGAKGDGCIRFLSLKHFFFIIICLFIICVFIICLHLLNVGSRITCLFYSSPAPRTI